MLETYVLHITKECNMDCTYCYEKDKTSVYGWGEIKSTIDGMVKYNKHFHLEFLGGEPCLRIDLIRKTVEYLESMSDVNVEAYTITTNGTLINDDLVDLMRSYKNISWAASIDGNKFMNFMRLMKSGYNSHDLVIKNLKILKDRVGGGQIGCHLVTHPYNIAYLIDGVKSLYDSGFRHMGIGTIESTITIDDTYCKEFIKQHKMLSDMMRNGDFPGLTIDLFNGLKSNDDERHYIRDDSGKVILETYGRSDGDIKDSEEYKTEPSSSPLGDMIYNIRKEVYDYHNR